MARGADPLVRPAAGREIADAVPGARLLLVEGMGHGLMRSTWPEIVAAIGAHLSHAAAS